MKRAINTSTKITQTVQIGLAKKALGIKVNAEEKARFEQASAILKALNESPASVNYESALFADSLLEQSKGRKIRKL
jgi:hypothetical protein